MKAPCNMGPSGHPKTDADYPTIAPGVHHSSIRTILCHGPCWAQHGPNDGQRLKYAGNPAFSRTHVKGKTACRRMALLRFRSHFAAPASGTLSASVRLDATETSTTACAKDLPFAILKPELFSRQTPLSRPSSPWLATNTVRPAQLTASAWHSIDPQHPPSPTTATRIRTEYASLNIVFLASPTSGLAPT
jgi:hypothetical protein